MSQGGHILHLFETIRQKQGDDVEQSEETTVEWLREERDRQVAIRDQRFGSVESRIECLEQTVERQAETIGDLMETLRSVRVVLGALD